MEKRTPMKREIVKLMIVLNLGLSTIIALLVTYNEATFANIALLVFLKVVLWVETVRYARRPVDEGHKDRK